MFSLSGQSPKVQANKSRETYIKLDNRTKSSTARNADRTGIPSIPRIYSQKEQNEIKELSQINYHKEFQRPNTVIKQSRVFKDEIVNGSHPVKLQPIESNLDNRLERIASAQTQVRSDHFFNISNHEAFFRETQRIYKNDCIIIANENLKQSQMIRFKALNKDGAQLNYQNAANLTMNPSSTRYISNILLMDEKTANEKGGEIFLSKNTAKKMFGVSTASKNEWGIEQKKPSLVNHSGSTFNPINPLLVNISMTKNQLQEINQSKLFYKPKALSDFIDLNRNGAPNHNNLFREEFKKNATCFHKTKGLCSNFYDTHHQYRSICPKPFFK